MILLESVEWHGSLAIYQQSRQMSERALRRRIRLVAALIMVQEVSSVAILMV